MRTPFFVKNVHEFVAKGRAVSVRDDALAAFCTL